MEYDTYIKCLRGGLCDALTEHKRVHGNIKRLNDIVEKVHLKRYRVVSSTCSHMVLDELDEEINFLEFIEDLYNKEINRLTKTLLDRN